MDELSPNARALLAAAHGSDDPIAGDATRIRRGVLVRIGSAGFGATVFSLCLQRAQAFASLAAPKLVAVALVAVSGSAVYHRVKRPAAEVASAQASSAPYVAAPTVARRALSPRVAAPLNEPVAVAVAEPALPAPRVFQARVPRHAPAVAARSSSLEAEMRWVRTADAALRNGDAGAAQGLLEQHAREFPNGALAEEREGLRLVATCQGGSAEAQRAAAQFLERAPHSLLAGRVRAACTQIHSAD